MAWAWIVHGPAGCGKTRFREDIAELLAGNRASFVDGWSHDDELRKGHVHLAQQPPPETRRALLRAHDVKVIAFSELTIAECGKERG